MNSQDAQAISMSPLVSEFVLAILKTIKSKTSAREEKHIIHADMVPKFSKRVVQASLGEKQIYPHRQPEMHQLQPVSRQPQMVQPPRREMTALVAPIQRPRPIIPQRMPPRRMQQPPMQMQQPRPTTQAPQPPQETQPAQNYGKITPLLNDPSVSSIECSGAGKPVTIIRAGQKQMTKITLTPGDIKEILQAISDTVHIPLLEGVFRAAVDDFSINAVISEMIGSRFVIKKQNAYSLLER